MKSRAREHAATQAQGDPHKKTRKWPRTQKMTRVARWLPRHAGTFAPHSDVYVDLLLLASSCALQSDDPSPTVIVQATSPPSSLADPNLPDLHPSLPPPHHHFIFSTLALLLTHLFGALKSLHALVFLLVLNGYI